MAVELITAADTAQYKIQPAWTRDVRTPDLTLDWVSIDISGVPAAIVNEWWLAD